MRSVVLLFSILFLLAVACDKEDPATTGTDIPVNKVEQNITIAESFMECWDTHDMDKLVGLFSESGVYEEVCSLRKFPGREAIKAYGTATIAGIPDTRFTVQSVVANETMAVVEWTWTGTVTVGWPKMQIPATGAAMELRGVSVMSIQKGKIVENRDYWDWNTFLKESGIG